jgi:peptide methionine sulfoxide reductase MsrA
MQSDQLKKAHAVGIAASCFWGQQNTYIAKVQSALKQRNDGLITDAEYQEKKSEAKKQFVDADEIKRKLDESMK